MTPCWKRWAWWAVLLVVLYVWQVLFALRGNGPFDKTAFRETGDK